MDGSDLGSIQAEELEEKISEIWKTIAFENIMHDIAQALSIDRSKIERAEGILFHVDEKTVKRFVARSRDVLERYLESPYGSLMSYYSSMGMKNYMEPLIKKLKDDLMECVSKAFAGKECNIAEILKSGKRNIKLVFLKRRKPFMRIDFHERKLGEIFRTIESELMKIISDYERIKPSGKRFLEVCLEIADIIRDPISYYNMIWTFGFIFKVLEFKEHEKYLFSILYRTLESFLGYLREVLSTQPDAYEQFIRPISGLFKDVFLHVAYFPELLRDSRFLDRLPKNPKNLRQELLEIINWLKTDRSYGRLMDIIRQRYEKEINKVFMGKLPLDTAKTIRILSSLEDAISKTRELDIDIALQLVHSLLFHQKSIQYTFSVIKLYLVEWVNKRLSEEKEKLEKLISHWKPFHENPDILPSHMEDLVREIHVSVSEDTIKMLGVESLADALKYIPLLSVSFLDVKYPDELLAVGNYILTNEKPGSVWEAEVTIVVNYKYRIRRKFWIERDVDERVIIKEKFSIGDIEAEYVQKSYSIFRRVPYMDFLEKKLDELFRKLEEIKGKIRTVDRLVGLIDQAIERLMVFDVERFHNILGKEKIVEQVLPFLELGFDDFLELKKIKSVDRI